MKRRVESRRKRHRKALLKVYKNCKACGSSENLTVDHITPFSISGDDSIQNKQVLCFNCNQVKSGHIGEPGMKEITKIIKQARGNGFIVEVGSHVKFTHMQTRAVTFAAKTGSDWRGLRNLKARLRRMGNEQAD